MRPKATSLILSLLTAGVAAAALFVLAMAPPAAAATSDSPACADCAALVDSLRADVAAYVPTTHQPVFLTAIDQASLAAGLDGFPPDPIQPDLVAASVILDGLTADTSDLEAAELVTGEGLAVIATDVNRLEAEFFTPTEPCQVASFDTLRADIGAYVPTTHQPPFLTAVDQATSLDLFPPDPIQPDLIAASVLLDRLTADTSQLQAAGLVTDQGLAAIATDVNTLEAEFFIPVDPCR